MKAVVHIGMEKTGTTTVQEFLYENRKTFIRQGFAFLTSPGKQNNRKFVAYSMSEDRADEFIHELGIDSPEKRKQWKKQFVCELSKEISNLGPGISTVLISSEHFHSRLKSKDEIESLHKLLKTYFSEISIFVYLRRQDEVAVSLYSTHCRVLGTRSTIINEGVKPNNHYYNYYNFIEKWASVFGQESLKIRLFDRSALQGGDILKDFIHCTGLAFSETFVYPARRNEKLSAPVQKALIVIHKFFPGSDKNNRAFKAKLIHQFEQRFKGAELTLTYEEAIGFYTMFAESNRKLAKKYFKRDELFSPDFSRYSKVTQDEMEPNDMNAALFNFIADAVKHAGLLDPETSKRLTRELAEALCVQGSLTT